MWAVDAVLALEVGEDAEQVELFELVEEELKAGDLHLAIQPLNLRHLRHGGTVSSLWCGSHSFGHFTPLYTCLVIYQRHKELELLGMNQVSKWQWEDTNSESLVWKSDTVNAMPKHSI